MLFVYQIDTELFAAHDAAGAAQLWFEQTGEKTDDEPRLLDDTELDEPQPEFDEDEHETGGKTSVRQMLFEHGDKPGWLATTDW